MTRLRQRIGIPAASLVVALLLAACGIGTPAPSPPPGGPLLTGAPALADEVPHACIGAPAPGRETLTLAPPAGGWSGAPQAVVLMNTFGGEVDIRHGDRDRCGTEGDARTLDSRFRIGVGTVLVPGAGDDAPIHVGYTPSPLPLWRPIVRLGQPAELQRTDIARFSLRIASIAIVLTLVMSALLTFFSTRERAYLSYAGTSLAFAIWQALLSGLWAWPRPWLPAGDDPARALVALAIAMAGMTVHALVRQLPSRRRNYLLERSAAVAAFVLGALALLVLALPAQLLTPASVVVEIGFYAACAGFGIAAASTIGRGQPGGWAMLAGVAPFIAIGLLEFSVPQRLALWKVEAFMLAGCWLALTCSMVLTLRLGLLRRQRDEMRHLAQTDALTGLPNRRAAIDQLEHAIAAARAQATSLTIAFLDLDHFKQINDRFGHEAGDRVLRHVAHALRGAFRNADYVARIGGEEFLAILPGADPAHAQARAQTLRTLLADSASVLGVPGLQVTASMGISVLDGPDDSPASLLQRADAAMYRAKHDGRDRTRVAGHEPA